MNEHEFQTKLAELMGEISTLPPTERNKLERLADETRQRHERLRQTVSGLQESLDYLRLSIKYLVFDLKPPPRERYSAKCSKKRPVGRIVRGRWERQRNNKYMGRHAVRTACKRARTFLSGTSRLDSKSSS